MKTICLFLFLLCQYCTSTAQSLNDSINKEKAKQIITFLAADEMKGRANFTKEQDLAAEFINKHFHETGLTTFPGFDNFFHTFPVYGLGSSYNDTGYLKNIIGILPGKTKPNEAVIFSAHYDHIKRGLKGETGQIYNGANDDASGTTAVMLLAKYFALRNDNERTIVFCLFAGEELGLLGSKAFVQLVKPETIKAVINIEMIGATNRTGKNAFFITGTAYSDIRKILQKNMYGTDVKIKKEGSDLSRLFQRSDNYSFAMLGIPAHTIMCSDDYDPCYHQACDDVERIDIENMTTIIQAIAICSQAILSGKETPKRIKL